MCCCFIKFIVSCTYNNFGKNFCLYRVDHLVLLCCLVVLMKKDLNCKFLKDYFTLSNGR